MKSALTLVGLTVLFFLVFLAGTLWDPFHLKWFITHPTLTSTRYFVPDGLLLMLAVYVLVVLIAAARKRFSSVGIATLAVVLAFVLGFFSKIGFATHDLF